MIRIQVEAHVGAITNLEAAKQAGYEVAIQSREARPGYPIHLVGERIFNASDGKLDEKFCVAANETYSHRDGTFGIEEAHVIGDLLKKYFVDAKLARIVRVCVTVFKSPKRTVTPTRRSSPTRSTPPSGPHAATVSPPQPTRSPPSAQKWGWKLRGR